MKNIIRVIIGLIELARPVNMLITALTVWVGGILAAGKEMILSPELILASIAAMLVGAGGNAINDAFDDDVDEFNRPNRPIPSERVDRNLAIAWASVLTAAGIIIGIMLSLTLGIFAFGIAVMLWLYSLMWKRSILVGNFTVAFCGAAAFIYGAIAGGNPTGGMWPALFAFLIHNGREIIKDIEDIEGDKMWGVMTLPVVSGPIVSQRIAASILFILAIVTMVPYYLRIYTIKYLIVVAAIVDLPLLIMIFLLWRGLEDEGLVRVSKTLKVLMLCGLVALYVG
ncbi:geranylgeranylglycerol-phosphate geranylgeranyltransferase [bacterium]|nr:geranylgeranylglycerol-phosphate geranylgeranyltransferase [bacterium]